MAENDNTESTDERRHGTSPALLIVGLLALAVSAWAFVGPVSWSSAGMIPIGWIAVLAAIVIGIILVISPRKQP
ncbi:hypothetical protein AB0C34_30640 [Nocardia sp. NPDC049220]|uniref:hypothetical protein n=1 Tax=Nocardia sp. NPDC049220 TaxID=3155273 RepID=UPI00340ACB26